MTAPDLSAAQAAVEALMTDTCRITRDAAGRGDDVLDEGTGQLIPSGAGPTVYEGPCLLSPAGSYPVGAAPFDVPAAQEPTARYVLVLPLSAAPVQMGDEAEALTSLRDPQLPGQSFAVKDAGEVATFAVSRRVPVERLDDGG